VSDLERFFRRLVANLAGTEPARLRQPLSLDDIEQSILPYRANRRLLGLDSSEEYELLLLRLCAGEDNLIRAEPEAARARFAEELRSPHPDLGVLRSFENVLVTLRAEPLARALDPAPQAPGFELAEPPQPRPPEPLEEPAEEPTARCLYCGGGLPEHRTVNFCPHCGQSQVPAQCPQCHEELDPGWRHCVNCGAAVGER
jgi:hypothetical protein